MVLLDLLEIFTNLTPEILEIYIDIFGIECDIYYPVDSDRFYDDSGKPKYASTPNISKQKLLLVNFLNPNAMRGTLGQFESFLDENRPYLITYEEKRIPPRARIDAWFKGAKMSFQTEIDRVLTGVLPEGGTHSTILVKQNLRPLT